MAVNPCTVCGGSELNLIDGYYYCVECGTQDVNARETIVESTMLADGTFAHAATRKFRTAIKDGLEMSGEWHKWHTYNFVLAGLTDELVLLGAKPTVKLKALWVWCRYVKKFQNKEEMGVSFGKSFGDITANASTTEDEDDDNTTDSKSVEKDTIKSNKIDSKAQTKEVDKKMQKIMKDLKIVTKGLLVAILYIALNLDESDIQLSHLSRYIRERRISIMDCSKFIPKDLDKTKIPHWKSFVRCTREPTPNYIRNITMSLFKGLDLGTPLVPDLRKLIDNYAAELCLPNDFRNLVYTLMNLVPCDFLDINLKIQKSLVRVPDFEVICMSYVLIALKMCFGLDCDYEVRLSELIDKINEEENHKKSHKLGMSSPATDRLFSFREWSNFLQFRKLVLCKYYLPMAHQHDFEVDDHVFMEHSTERPQRKKLLRDEVTIDILNRVNPIDDDMGAIPINEFKPTLTPMSTYTQVIIEYIQDPHLKVLLSEDFTQYSLKYASGDIKLPIEGQSLFIGVSELDKTIKKNIIGTLVSKKADTTMVYVRNCENKNWLKTNPPTKETIIKEIKEDDKSDVSNSVSIDNSNETDTESSPMKDKIKSDTTDDVESTITDSLILDKEEKELEVIEEENEGISIFDDNFEDLVIKDEPSDEVSSQQSRRFPFEFEDGYFENETDLNIGNAYNEWDNQSNATDFSLPFDQETFDRERTIKELILVACKKHRIPVPPEYKRPRPPRKRKSEIVHIGVGETVPKKRKRVWQPGENKREVDKILTEYYDTLQKDVLNTVSEHVTSVVQRLGLDEFENPVDGDHNAADINKNGDVETQDHDESNPKLVDEINEKTLTDITSGDEFNIEDLLPKSDPKFDEKTHDIRQLYLKFKEKFNLNKLVYDDDPELDKILSKHLEKASLEEFGSDKEATEAEEDSSNSEDDDEENERILMETKNRQRDENLEPFLKNAEGMKEFRYWFRHYTCEAVKKNLDLKKFDSELNENFPVSFTLVIQECASILGYTAYTLYKKMQDMEQILISRSKYS